MNMHEPDRSTRKTISSEKPAKGLKLSNSRDVKIGQPTTAPRSIKVNKLQVTERKAKIMKNIFGNYKESVISGHVLTGQALKTDGLIRPTIELGRDMRLTLDGKEVQNFGIYAGPRHPQGKTLGIDDRAKITVDGETIYLDTSYREVLRLAGYSFFDELNSALAKLERNNGTVDEALELIRNM